MTGQIKLKGTPGNFTETDFTATKFATAEEKARIANKLTRFILGGFKQNSFSKAMYTRLSNMYRAHRPLRHSRLLRDLVFRFEGALQMGRVRAARRGIRLCRQPGPHLVRRRESLDGLDAGQPHRRTTGCPLPR